MKKLILALCLLAIGSCSSVQWAYAEPDYERLANAIYKAEGGAKTSHPYGIMKRYKTTTPRQACINTLKHRWAEYALLRPQDVKGCPDGYLRHVQASYAPLGATNDPSNLNVNWYNNVRRLYGKA